VAEELQMVSEPTLAISHACMVEKDTVTYESGT
jgi:hypothetical protein